MPNHLAKRSRKGRQQFKVEDWVGPLFTERFLCICKRAQASQSIEHAK